MNIEAEVNEAFTKKNKLTAYLIELSAERARLLSGVLGDPVETIVRIAQIDTELSVKNEASRAYSARYEEMKKRQENKKGQGNYIFSIAKRG